MAGLRRHTGHPPASRCPPRGQAQGASSGVKSIDAWSAALGALAVPRHVVEVAAELAVQLLEYLRAGAGDPAVADEDGAVVLRLLKVRSLALRRGEGGQEVAAGLRRTRALAKIGRVDLDLGLAACLGRKLLDRVHRAGRLGAVGGFVPRGVLVRRL